MDEIKEAKNWLSALEVNSEFEASSKEYILSYIEQLEKENKQLKISYKLMENEAMKDGLEERKKQKERINKYIEILNKYKERSKYIISNNRLEKLPDGVRAISEYFTPDTVIQMLENIKEGFR